MRERIWRSIFFIIALSVIAITNTWMEAEKTKQRHIRLTELVVELRTIVHELLMEDRMNIRIWVESNLFAKGKQPDGVREFASVRPLGSRMSAWLEDENSEKSQAGPRIAADNHGELRRDIQQERLNLLRTIQSYPIYEKLTSLEVIYIPDLLRWIEQEEEAVGQVLAAVVREIGRLQLDLEAWSSTAEWKALWNERVLQAEQQVPIILADEQLTTEAKEALLVSLGAPAVPHLIEQLKVRHSEAGILAIEQLLGPTTKLPPVKDQQVWRKWANRYHKQYAPLKHKFH